MKTITLLLRGLFVTLCVVFVNSLIMSLYHFEYRYWQDIIPFETSLERYVFFYLTLALFAVFNAVTIIYAFKIYEHLSDVIKGAYEHADIFKRKTRRKEDTDHN